MQNSDMWDAIERNGHTNLMLELHPNDGSYIAQTGENEWIEFNYVKQTQKNVTTEMLERKASFLNELNPQQYFTAQNLTQSM